MVDETAKYVSRIYQILGLGVWFPLGQDYMAVIKKEVMLIDLNIIGMLLEFYLGYIFISTGYIILRGKKKNA